MSTDPVALAAELIRCPSVTPADGGALVLLAERLAAAGFRSERVDRNGITNLYTRWGSDGPALGFNGHTDVVPPGDVAAWKHDPFAGVVAEGALHGRGAADMKSGVAAFVAAAIDFVTATPPRGSVIVTVTGDEEGVATDGTVAILDWMAARGERMDHCLVGEPTCPERMGEAIKIGRRGSLTARLTAYGVQGHSAYPERAKNPLPALVRLLDRLAARELDSGTAHFGASTLAITTVDTGNPASNVIPAEARATVNIRFNDAHSGASLSAWIEEEADRAAAEFGIGIAARFEISGESFVTERGAFTDLVARAVEAETGVCAGALDLGGHLGRAVHQGSLPSGGGGAGRGDDAPDRRAGGGGACSPAQGDLRADPAGVFRRSAGVRPVLKVVFSGLSGNVLGRTAFKSLKSCDKSVNALESRHWGAQNFPALPKRAAGARGPARNAEALLRPGRSPGGGTPEGEGGAAWTKSLQDGRGRPGGRGIAAALRGATAAGFVTGRSRQAGPSVQEAAPCARVGGVGKSRVFGLLVKRARIPQTRLSLSARPDRRATAGGIAGGQVLNRKCSTSPSATR